MKRATYYSGDGVFTMWISIHALVKRATTLTVTGAAIADISIHALVKRATCRPIRQNVNVFHFNPRPREEGDRDSAALSGGISLISIHALVKRATQFSHGFGTI